MAEIDVLKAQIVRNSLDASWGFELEGGADGAQPLAIQQVAPDSAASRIGLKPGDAITEIGDRTTGSLTLQESYEEINQYGLSLILTIERRSEPGSAPPETITVPVTVPVDVPLEPLPVPVPVVSVAPQPAPVVQSSNALVMGSQNVSVANEGSPVQEPAKQPQPPQAAVTLVSDVQMTPQPVTVTVKAMPFQSPPGQLTHTNVQGDPVKGYQTFDMTGKAPDTSRQRQPATKQAGHPGLHKMDGDAPQYNFETAQGHPYAPPADKPQPQMYQTYLPHAAESMPYAEAGRARHNPQLYASVPYQDRARKGHSDDYYHDYYAPKMGMHDPGYNVQSPTFSKLEGVMANENIGTGMQGQNALPPVRSAVMEKKKAEEISKKKDMVKVFMPQQYNSPMNLYSLPNVVESFAGQAEAQMSNMERRPGMPGGQYKSQSAVQSHNIAPALLHQNQGNFSDM